MIWNIYSGNEKNSLVSSELKPPLGMFFLCFFYCQDTFKLLRAICRYLMIIQGLHNNEIHALAIQVNPVIEASYLEEIRQNKKN